MYSAADKAGLIRIANFPTTSRRYRNAWFNLSCKEAKEALHTALRECKKENYCAKACQSVASCKAFYRNLCQAKKEAHIQNIKDSFANVSVPANFWATVRKFCSKEGVQSVIPIETWNDFYADIYHPRVIIPPPSTRIEDDILDAEISYTELDFVLSTLKTGKAAGPDLLTNELFESLTGQCKEILRNLLSRSK